MKRKYNLIVIGSPFVFCFLVYLISHFLSKIFSCSPVLDFDENWEMVYWTIALVFATIYLGVVAAYQDSIRNWLYSPQLSCDLTIKSPHSHLYKTSRTYYFRFRIHNKGKVSARKVEVIIKNVKDEKGKEIELSTDNLKWSTEIIEAIGFTEMQKDKHQAPVIVPIQVQLPRMYWDHISPGTYQYCNLGSISKPLDNETDLEFSIAVYWQTPDRKFVIKPGIYSFELIIGSENSDPVKMHYKIRIGKRWYENEKEMFEKSIEVLEEKEVK